MLLRALHTDTKHEHLHLLTVVLLVRFFDDTAQSVRKVPEDSRKPSQRTMVRSAGLAHATRDAHHLLGRQTGRQSHRDAQTPRYTDIDTQANTDVPFLFLLRHSPECRTGARASQKPNRCQFPSGVYTNYARSGTQTRNTNADTNAKLICSARHSPKCHTSKHSQR